MKNLLILLLFCTMAPPAFSQLNFQNNTREPVTVAIAMHATGGGFKGWFTKGWFRVAPNEKVRVYEASGISDVYYFAFNDNGKAYSGDQYFYVHPSQAFLIRNADMQYVQKENFQYETRPFRKVTMPAIKIGYTIKLDY